MQISTKSNIAVMLSRRCGAFNRFKAVNLHIKVYTLSKMILLQI